MSGEQEGQGELFESSSTDEEAQARDRAVIDQLIADTRLYESARTVKELLDFTARLRHIAPFNAMLLHIQKPGLTFAARPSDWQARFGRRPKPHARPLVILHNFGPVDFVYDILDPTDAMAPPSRLIPVASAQAHTDGAACPRRDVGSNTRGGWRPAPGRRGSCWSFRDPGGLG